MDRVRDVLAVKGSQVWSIGAGATVLEALRLMADKDVGALLVTEGGEPVGIFSERDHVRRVAETGRPCDDVPVREVLTSKVLCVPPERTIHECMAIMTDKHVRHLPVVSAGKVVGMVSIGDIVKAVVSQQQHLIGQLESYIVRG